MKITERLGKLEVDGDAETLVDYLNSLIEKHGVGTITLSIEEDDYEDYRSVYIYLEREETPEEQQKRERIAEELAKKKKERDLLRLKQLKEQYKAIE